MKKKYLLFAAFAGITSLTLSSYSNGPIAGGAGNRSGSAGSAANCGGSGCHSDNTANTAISMVVQDANDPRITISAYVPGRTYNVVFLASNASSLLSRWGFQLSAVRAAATNTQAGSFSTSTAGTVVRTTGGLSIVEHTTPIAATSAGIYTVTVRWTAPLTAGAGTVKFFGVANVVNFNGTVSGDMPNAGSLELPEATVSVAGVNRALNVQAFPSPAINTLQLEAGDVNGKNYNIAVFDMTGRRMQQTIMSGNKQTLDVSGLASGHYMVVVSGSDAQGSINFVKQ